MDMWEISACDNVVIAVVGRRDAMERYLKIAKMVGSVLANKGFTVLNGLAIAVSGVEALIEFAGQPEYAQMILVG